jgi:hypothetical protein
LRWLCSRRFNLSSGLGVMGFEEGAGLICIYRSTAWIGVA